MARITTEHGKGYEYFLHGPNRNLKAIIFPIYIILDLRIRYSDIRLLSHRHILRFYKDKFEICKYSQLKRNKKFKVYEKSDIKSVSKGISFYPVPLVLIALVAYFGFATGLLWIAIPALLFLPFCFGRCLKFKRKKGLSIRIGYSVFSEKELIERIIANY